MIRTGNLKFQKILWRDTPADLMKNKESINLEDKSIGIKQYEEQKEENIEKR